MCESIRLLFSFNRAYVKLSHAIPIIFANLAIFYNFSCVEGLCDKNKISKVVSILTFSCSTPLDKKYSEETFEPTYPPDSYYFFQPDEDVDKKDLARIFKELAE